ncbi:dUTP diphosphatase [Ureaplasma miroungigenitalium]|uniref:dUTP diphosphatase n=1 Tax=Ureaplasma miroungigenitalium TaxID=1042321 RepID=UPI0021E9ADE4|nr:dUTP diphosphatase [Ureaplasma miroungigenitalium]MCV3734472.1 dUTP diphosphatase [Ureaplasma miroungigenitalium]
MKSLVFNIQELYELQEKLDNTIAQNKDFDPQTDYKTQRILALLVEIGELANEIQMFKYWKTNKQINREKMLDELADVLHFACAHAYRLQASAQIIVQETTDDLNQQFISLYAAVSTLAHEYQATQMQKVLEIIFGICTSLELDWSVIRQAYIKKNEINYKRVASGY